VGSLVKIRPPVAVNLPDGKAAPDGHLSRLPALCGVVGASVRPVVRPFAAARAAWAGGLPLTLLLLLVGFVWPFRDVLLVVVICVALTFTRASPKKSSTGQAKDKGSPAAAWRSLGVVTHGQTCSLRGAAMLSEAPYDPLPALSDTPGLDFLVNILPNHLSDARNGFAVGNGADLAAAKYVANTW
jgi:hypothetical protein